LSWTGSAIHHLRLVRAVGARGGIQRLSVETIVSEITFGQLVRHELRWLRTIRAVNPHGYRFSFLTFSFPVAA
jgi:ceramide glucosyltransferase